MSIAFLHRYQRSGFLFNHYLTSKYHVTHSNVNMNQIKISAGLYKPNSLTYEHSFILSSLTGKAFQVEYQLHGKRRRKTLATTTKLKGNTVWFFLDKFINEILTHTYEFETPKYRKYGKLSKGLTMRFRQKLRVIDEFDDLISAQMHDTHKGIFLPLTIHLALNQIQSNFINETFFRMLQLPFNFYKRKAKPAFDDKLQL